MSSDILERTFYGVWMPGKGWLKVQNDSGYSDCYSDTQRNIVEDTAARFHGEVRFIDASLFRLETQILQQEEEDRARALAAATAQLAHDRKRGNAWRTFRIWFGNLSRR